ncbi:hypothetical protein CAEBREN_20901 [Caenorhabditis brenneri]|uniref:Uncharacterized protein n=1 Tax=Caenorhabditis brenneri TaxID=135651 RepID=G0MMP6_CAEBE|nr:hypothetical protein CAEBREN_20901 [Caenorhabditis brenneri]
MLPIFVLSCLLVTALSENPPIIGSPCSNNQVIHGLTRFKNGSIEIQCAPIPCGEVGKECVDDSIQCRNETEVPTALKRGPNNQTILFRCCCKPRNDFLLELTLFVLEAFMREEKLLRRISTETMETMNSTLFPTPDLRRGVRVWVDRMFCPKEKKPVEFDSITTTSAPKVTKITPAPVPTTPVDEEAGNDNIFGSPCSKNQVISKLTLFEDGKIAIECAPVTCMQVRSHCVDDQIQCRPRTDPETEILSGMRWASNSDSIMLRCCTMQSKVMIYIGTDIVRSGTFYEGGKVADKDLYGPDGDDEFDFVANVKAEEAGVRVWVYRMFCPKGEKPVDFKPITITSAPKVIKTRAAPVPSSPVV